MVIGLLTAANAAGQLVFLPTMAAMVDLAGWRVMSLALAVFVLAFVPVRLADAGSAGGFGLPRLRRHGPAGAAPAARAPATRSRSPLGRWPTARVRAISG